MPEFLPEDDREYLREKQYAFREEEEPVPGGKPRLALIVDNFSFDAELYRDLDGTQVRVTSCELLILIPEGYNTTQLDSWYTRPRLFRANGRTPDRTEHTDVMFGGGWQFWSRHLDPSDWRPGLDGLASYLGFVWRSLRGP